MAAPPPTSSSTQSETELEESDTGSVVVADSIHLKNSKIDVWILGWDSFIGFRVDKVELKDYTMKVDVKSTQRVPVQLIQETKFKTREHAGFEVIARDAPYVDSLESTVSNDSSSVVFLWKDSLGNETRVSLTLDGYQIHFESLQAASYPSRFRFICVDGLLPTEPGDKMEIGLYQLYYRDKYKKVQWLKASKIKKLEKGEYELEPGPYDWMALRNKYFAAIVLPTSSIDVTFLKPALLNDQRIALNRFDVEFNVEKEKPGFTLYFGPQDYDILAKMGHKLGRIVELGGSAFRWLGVIMLKIFQFFYRIIGNYGVAIIVFSILIKLIFLPLSQVQQRSMQKMQVLQPKLKELQERFKDDKKRLNEETMKLYKLHGASPFKGCLPMLIQLPVFFGLYAVLRNAIELRGAPFVKLFTITVSKPINLISENFLNLIRIPAGELTWLADLSQHDPFYILPILMGVASVFQSLLTNPNPQQRLMTFMMPILITVIFLNFPSGLQLYWFLFNLLSILEFTIFRRGAKAGGDQWQPKRLKEITSARSLPKSSRR
jgi:YidC/Oxa1 family membrane protein insertase